MKFVDTTKAARMASGSSLRSLPSVLAILAIVLLVASMILPNKWKSKALEAGMIQSPPQGSGPIIPMMDSTRMVACYLANPQYNLQGISCVKLPINLER